METDLIYDVYWDELLSRLGKTGRNTNQFFTEFFMSLCIKLDAKLVLEIGAHGAEFSKSIAQSLPEARVLAFEANPHVYNRIRASIPPGVSYIQSLVSSDDRDRTLFIPVKMMVRGEERVLSNANTTSGLRKRLGDVEYEETVCKSTTVDQICKQENWIAPCAMWIDVEGAVGEVLFGAHQSLNKTVKLILAEVETIANWEGQWVVGDVRNYLQSQGFIPLCRDRETPWQFNEMYIRKECLDNTVLSMLRTYIENLLSTSAAESNLS